MDSTEKKLLTKKITVIKGKLKQMERQKPTKKPRIVKRTQKRFVIDKAKKTLPTIIESKPFSPRYLTLKRGHKIYKKSPDYINTDKLLLDVPINYDKKNHYYLYKITEVVETDFEHIHSIEGKTKIHLCMYRINDSGHLPFLQYYLYKYPKKYHDCMILPYKKYDGRDSILSFSDTFARTLTSSLPLPELTSVGYIQHDNNVYMFYDIGSIKNEVDEKFRSDKWWWVLISEIVNFKKVTNFPIHHNVTNLFIKHPDLLYLFNKESKIIETPMIAYHGTPYQLMSLVKSYGLKASTLKAMMGPYYYFGTFRKVVRYAGWTSSYNPRYIDGKLVTDEDGRYLDTDELEHGNPGGILRFALFLGEMKAFLNHPDDPDDISEEKMKGFDIKMTDHRGMWTTHYNSVYIGRVRLENGRLFMSNPEYVVKQFEQQIILSAHFLDRTTLQANWEPTYEHYQIA